MKETELSVRNAICSLIVSIGSIDIPEKNGQDILDFCSNVSFPLFHKGFTASTPTERNFYIYSIWTM